MKKADRINRVLVVEDELVISQICIKTLVKEGFEVDTAPNGLIAKGFLAGQEYDYCLIDIRTPHMSGIEFYHYLEKNCPQLISGVILTTGDCLSPNAASFLNEVNRPFLPKPFTPSELRATMEKTKKKEQGGRAA